MVSRLTIQPLINFSELLNISRHKVDNNIHVYRNGRSSLYICLNLILKKFNADQILLPSVICDEIIPIIEQFKIKIVFYDLDDSLAIDFDKLENKLLNRKTILLIVNFFGFKNEWEKINKLNNHHNLITIEDNAHCNASNKNDADFSFNSLRKIYPLLSGSILKINNAKYNEDFIYRSSIPRSEELIYFLRNYARSKKSYSKSKNKNVLTFNANDIYIDFISKYLIKNSLKSDEKYKKIRLRNYHYWQNYLPEDELRPIFKTANNPEYSPYVYPCIASDKDYAEKWIKWGINNNITVMSWPKFPEIVPKEMLTNAHMNILCFPVNQQLNVAEFLKNA